MRDPKDFHILIVDDEEEIRTILQMHFSLDGYTVLTAGSGNEALGIVKENKIDFVISDIRMPDGSGDSLLTEIRAMDPEIPVIVLVTGFSEFSKEEAIAKGALDLMPKPIDLDKIQDYIKEQFQGPV